MKKYYMIGNTHFDPVWLWKWDEAMASIRATFRSALDRMNEDENFVYSFATPPVFEWIKRTDPVMFSEIKKRVEEGRWEICEGWWLQPDCYSGCGESYVRQGLYGQRYLKENFDKMTKTVFNIDSFGHSPQLPQILKKSGINNYCFVRPEKSHIELENHYFKWQGIDGSEVLAYRAELAYEPDVNDTAEKLDYLAGDNHMIVYGVTDHGGAPTKKSIRDINENPNMEFSTVENFFDKMGDTDYVVDRELLTGDFGPYSNGVDIKKYNSLAENAVLNAEKSAIISGRNENKALKNCWEDIMFNQFHDILGGASIKEAYCDAKNQLGRAISTAEYIMHTNLQLVTSKIKMLGKNPDNAWNLVVWNLNGCDYTGYIETEVQWMHEFPKYNQSICLEDKDKNIYECQIIREKSVIPCFRSRFVFKATIPAMGYKVFKVVNTYKDTKLIEDENINPYIIETKVFKVEISRENGSIESILNKKTNKVLNDLLVPNCYFDDGDTWCFNIKEYGKKVGQFKVCDIKVTENGAHRTKIKITSKYENSIFTVYYTFYDNEKYIDVSYKVNWNEKHIAFKLDMNVENDGVLTGVPAGSVLRKGTKGDVPMNKWISFGETGILTDSIFAYNENNKNVGLTVLRSPIYGDLRLGEINYDDDYEIMSQGVTEGNIRILFDKIENIQNQAEIFANPCIVISESNHDGKNDYEGSFFKINTQGVSLMALKYCEDDDGVIVRLLENENKEKEASFIFKGQLYKIQMKEYEIKTLKIKENKMEEISMLEM